MPAPRRSGSQAEAYDILESLDLAQFAFRPAAGLPFGTLKRLELARALASHPRLILLDEPAAGLTHAEVDELGRDDQARCATSTASPCCSSSTTWAW